MRSLLKAGTSWPCIRLRRSSRRNPTSYATIDHFQVRLKQPCHHYMNIKNTDVGLRL